MCSAEVMKTCPVDNTFKLIGKKFYYSDNMQYVKQTVKIQWILKIDKRDEPKGVFCKAKGNGKAWIDKAKSILTWKANKNRILSHRKRCGAATDSGYDGSVLYEVL